MLLQLPSQLDPDEIHRINQRRDEKKKRKEKKAVLTSRWFLLNNDILMRNFVIDNLWRFQKMCFSLWVVSVHLVLEDSWSPVLWCCGSSGWSKLSKQRGAFPAGQANPVFVVNRDICRAGVLPSHSHKQKSTCMSVTGEANTQRHRSRIS